ncbi:MAG TPA: hypothetical protein VEJ23_00955 [Solirubrobacteraceae bacterium]|nr:hypothetical protein [Solirubrobacteraceae bacterium]
MRRVLVVAGCGMAGVSLTACESTEQESAKLNREGQRLLTGQGALKVGALNHSVKVSDVTLLSASGRAAVAMRVSASSTTPQLDLPLLVDVTGSGSKQLYSNEAGGLEASLQHVSLARPGQATWWVDDQVLLPQGSATSSDKATVRVGSGASPHRPAPVLAGTSGVHLGQQDGLATAEGEVDGPFPSAHSKVPVFVVAQRNGRVVAAGRAVVSSPPRSGEHVPFQILLVGEPTGASLQVSVAPAES